MFVKFLMHTDIIVPLFMIHFPLFRLVLSHSESVFQVG